ncbi:MAG TPA: F0F1 ATP synthase subunit A [Gemmataceae bacterium]|jgi:F-type H+-transporting ATPase subunit a|nr:F0F1 ATP synthase subunit A [Gemmataceae bacterium]
MADEPISPLDALKDPFAESADTYHWDVCKSLGWEWHMPEWLSKFMVLETIAFVVVLVVFLTAAKRIAKGDVPRGRFAHFVESILLFIRDEVAIPTIGEHDYKRFLPLLWTMFVFIATMNLLGMIPFMGSPTASIAVTAVLATVAFFVIHINGILANHGFGHYVKTFKVKLDREGKLLQILAPVIEFGVFWLEIGTAFIRAIVLAVRLFANMLAGHTTLFVVMSFIYMVGLAVEQGLMSGYFFWPITVTSVATLVALSILEIFVGLLQAFVFVFLTSTFIGMAMHPEH